MKIEINLPDLEGKTPAEILHALIDVFSDSIIEAAEPYQAPLGIDPQYRFSVLGFVSTGGDRGEGILPILAGNAPPYLLPNMLRHVADNMDAQNYEG